MNRRSFLHTSGLGALAVGAVGAPIVASGAKAVHRVARRDQRVRHGQKV